MRTYLKNITILLLILSVSCNTKKTDTPPIVSADTTTIVQPVNLDSMLVSTGTAVLKTLKEKDLSAFSAFFENGRAVRFSPYGYIDTVANLELTKSAFDSLVASGDVVQWGSFDGSGDPMQLNAKQYIDKFVYNADFLKAEKTAVDSFIGHGNSLNNLKKIYPDARFIEYHFSGFDKKYGGMDWTSLRLVFKEVDHSYKLIAIVHDQWTT